MEADNTVLGPLPDDAFAPKAAVVRIMDDGNALLAHRAMGAVDPGDQDEPAITSLRGRRRRQRRGGNVYKGHGAISHKGRQLAVPLSGLGIGNEIRTSP